MSDKHETFIDPVNHPQHYTSHPSGIECWQVIKHLPKELADVIKYLWRTDLKNGAEDIRKAVWYLNENGYITFQILQKCKEIFEENAIYAEIAWSFEKVDLTPASNQLGIGRKVGRTILGDALGLIMSGVNGSELNDFLQDAYALKNRINEELEKEGK
ncbi:DUF3310 domain-containing protein [uncultured Rothia sp.]|uniref:DUF3310 domain-containing protein n=1 Tax=uncultured Rothia sp. TaxID=316088 RepID=UPI00321720DB